MYLLLKVQCVVVDSKLQEFILSSMGDLEDQGSPMSNSHHSFFESSSIGGMSRLKENTYKNTILNRSDVVILETGEMEMSQNGIEMVSDEEEINAELSDEDEFQSLYKNISNFQTS